MNEHNDDSEQHELEKLRLKKMKALMDAQKRQQATQERVISINDKIVYVLRVVLSPDAFSYLEKIKSNEPMVYRAIYNELVSPDVVSNIDYLIAIINRQGGVPRKIPLDAIVYLERKIKGIKGKIQVKKGDGEMMDLGSFLTK
jgi:DNA-binding TFAR19-related protein (PDSD5 family)